MSIIAILATLGAVVAQRAIVGAKNAAIKVEISQLDAALKLYKEKFGEYPPDGTDDAVTLQHLRKAFPRWTGSSLPGYLQNPNLNPQTALAFWLGGLPDANGVPSGFAADPANPFQTPAQCAARIKPFYEFDASQLASGTVSTSNMASYRCWPKRAIGNKTSGALVYFRAENGTYGTKTCTDAGDASGIVYPAVDTRVSGNPAVNASSYQIFSAGLDTKFGNPGSALRYPAGDNYNNDNTGYVYDNITNFVSKGTLEADIP